MSEQSSQHHPPLFGTSVANRSSSCVNGLYTENAQAPSQANGVTGPYLIVVEQPSERCRFRYKAEQTAHLGVQRPQPSAKAKQKCCPKVQLVNYSGAIGEGWHVVARLYTNEAEPRLHVNDLWRSDSEDGICVVPIQPDGLACFPNVVIMRQKEKDVAGILYEKLVKDCQQRGQTLSDADLEQLKESANREHVTMKDCLHSVRFGFHAVFTDQATGQSFATPVTYSEPIFNTQNAGYTELRIAELDKSQGSVAGGDSIWLRCASKVRKDQVRVRFHEPATGWEAEGQFTANEVYEQILIIFTTPPYRDVNITEPVHVNLHLFRAADGELSPPINFVYMPADDAPNRKRRRMVPTFGPDNYGYRYDGQAAPSVDNNASSTWGNYYGTASELNAYQPSGGHHEPYYQNYTVHGPHSRPSMSVGQDEQIGVDEIKQVLASATGEGPARIQHIMSELWKTNLTALWLFASEGDPQAMVSASRHLIGWQNDADGCT
uniref:RHD domain-containing protein n=1 Tax=Plectus sambesii TaxID=2011161 RepID=A0A914XNZ0_9BILA